MSLKDLQRKLAVLFDDRLETRIWHNVMDYLIITMIIVSTVEIFLSTFDLDPTLRKMLRWVDIVTLVFFTIEVSLRIWVAPELDARYKGLKGRLRYCFTFHGFIDAVATYPYWFQWLLPIPVGWIRVLRISRVMRLMRVSRYMKSWRLLSDAIREKRRELLISMQFLFVVTFILALVLFFFEHDAQPDVYDNGFSSVAWAFAQYIGDPGGFGDTPPVTLPGKIIACVVGLLGIAIVAVPAGILGAGFTEAIEKESHKEQLEENREKLRLSFERKLDRPTRYQVVPPYRTITHIQSRQGMTADEIINAVNETPGYRLVNLSSTQPVETHAADVLAVEHFRFNRPYGLLIDRQSPVTIIAPSSFIDDCTCFFAYYLAKTGGFNLISREFGKKAPYRSYFILKDGEREEGEREFLEDVERLLNRPGAWSVTFLIASGAAEPEYPTQVHVGTGNVNGVTDSIGDLIHDKERFTAFYDALSSTLAEEFGMNCDRDRYHNTSNPRLLFRQLSLPADSNDIVLRVAWSAALWDSRRIALARAIACVLNKTILGLNGNPDDAPLKVKAIGYD